MMKLFFIMLDAYLVLSFGENALEYGALGNHGGVILWTVLTCMMWRMFWNDVDDYRRTTREEN